MPLNQTLRKNSHVLWTVSIVQDQNPEAQTKSEFSEMTSDVLNTDTIDTVTLCLADNLQRFRLMIQHGISEEEAIVECQKMATVWHTDNLPELEKLKENKKLSLLTWQEFREWPDYDATIQAVDTWYKENRDFRNDVDGRIRQAADAIGKDAKITNPIQQTELLKKYLFEECAYQKFAASKGFNYEIYKTPMSKAMRRIKNNTDFVPRGYMIELHFTQFNPSIKKYATTNGNSINHVLPSINSERDSFIPVFSRKNNNYPVTVELSIPIKFAEFIEKTLQMLSKEEQEKAFEALMNFTVQEILPRCYSNKSILKI